MEQSNNGMPSPELRALLRQTFGVKKQKDKPKTPVPLPIHDEPSKEKARGVGNVMLSAAAQQIYSPPPAAPMKPPTTPQVNRGTVGGMDNTGPWGGPGGKK